MKFGRMKRITASLAFAISIGLSSGMGAPVSAMAPGVMDGMGHESTTVSNCLNQHHASPAATQKVKPNEYEDEDDTPLPSPVPFFVQFQKDFPDTQRPAPKDIICSSSYRPPDIVRLTSAMRF